MVRFDFNGLCIRQKVNVMVVRSIWGKAAWGLKNGLITFEKVNNLRMKGGK